MPNKDFPKPSEEFWDAITNTGTNYAECGFCHRIHFIVSEKGFDWKEGELEELLEKSKKNPEKYIPDYEHDSISLGDLDGRQAVYNCPCNSVSRYEQFISEHKHIISEYFSLKAEKQKQIVEENSKLAQKIRDSVNKLE